MFPSVGGHTNKTCIASINDPCANRKMMVPRHASKRGNTPVGPLRNNHNIVGPDQALAVCTNHLILCREQHVAGRKAQ